MMSSASSQLMRSNSPEPRLPVRFMGYLRRSGLLIHFRTERAFRQERNETPPNSSSPSVSLSTQRRVPSTTWHFRGQATKPQWQQLCQMTSPSSGMSLATTSVVPVCARSSPFSAVWGAQPKRELAAPAPAMAAKADRVGPLTNPLRETVLSVACAINGLLSPRGDTPPVSVPSDASLASEERLV